MVPVRHIRAPAGVRGVHGECGRTGKTGVRKSLTASASSGARCLCSQRLTMVHDGDALERHCGMHDVTEVRPRGSVPLLSSRYASVTPLLGPSGTRFGQKSADGMKQSRGSIIYRSILSADSADSAAAEGPCRRRAEGAIACRQRRADGLAGGLLASQSSTYSCRRAVGSRDRAPRRAPPAQAAVRPSDA